MADKGGVEATCTINESFAGIPLGNCGEPAVGRARFVCPNRHDETVPVCDQHGLVLGEIERGEWSVPMFCTACLEDSGDHVPVEVSLVEAVSAE